MARQPVPAASQTETMARRAVPGGGSDLYLGPGFDLEMDIASNGDIFIGKNRPGTVGIQNEGVVLRSQDGGETFQEIQIFSVTTGGSVLGALNVVEGSVNRIYVLLYDEFPGSLILAYADLSAVTGPWTTTTISGIPGLIRDPRPDLGDDSLEFISYFLYVVWSSNDGDGADIWFSRSTDFGVTWDTPYRIGDNTAGSNFEFLLPRVAYGNGVLHTGWTHSERNQDTFDDAVLYRRALNFANSGLSDWDPVVTMYPGNDGQDQRFDDIEASSASGDVLFLYEPINAQNSLSVRASFDQGSTWPAGNETSVGLLAAGNLIYRPGAVDFVVSGMLKSTVGVTGFGEAGYRTIKAAAPNVTLGAIDILQDSPAVDQGATRMGLAMDTARGEQVALAWYYFARTLFDAQWRIPQSFPQPEPGFPVAILGTPYSSPAIEDLDNDGTAEIVFGTIEGSVYVLEHDGSIRAGWPQPTGPANHRAPVAVGDLNGDGIVEIVAATADGRVFSFSPNGELNPGWPVDLATGAPAFLCIGAIGPPYPRHVVVGSGNRLFALSYRGENRAPFWQFTENFTQPPSVGDVDGDLIPDIVSVNGSSVRILQLGTTSASMVRPLPGKTISGPAALADFDQDGDLEIVVPTAEGDVYIMHHDGSDMIGWPYSDPVGGYVYPVAVAQNLGTTAPDLSFVQLGGEAHLFTQDGVEQSSYPVATSPSLGGVILSPVNRLASNLLISGADALMWSVENLGGTPPGWPRSMGNLSGTAPAAGDIDLDGRVELVLVTRSEVRVWELEQGPDSPQRQWPMYGYDAQRSSCLACAEDVVTAVIPVPQISRNGLLAPYPNPAVSSVRLNYSLSGQSQISLEVYDLRGRRVRTLRSGESAPGNHLVIFDGRDQQGKRLARGVYLVRLRVRGEYGAEEFTRKIVWAR